MLQPFCIVHTCLKRTFPSVSVFFIVSVVYSLSLSVYFVQLTDICNFNRFRQSFKNFTFIGTDMSGKSMDSAAAVTTTTTITTITTTTTTTTTTTITTTTVITSTTTTTTTTTTTE